MKPLTSTYLRTFCQFSPKKYFYNVFSVELKLSSGFHFFECRQFEIIKIVGKSQGKFSESR
jgi:hypothetical protein